MDTQTQYGLKELPPAAQPDAFAAWQAEVKRFGDLLRGNFDCPALLAIPTDGDRATRVRALLSLWGDFGFVPTNGPFAYGDTPPEGADLATPWGGGVFARGETPLAWSLAGHLQHLHFHTQRVLADDLAAEPSLSRSFISTKALPFELVLPHDPPRGAVVLPASAIAKDHPLWDRLAAEDLYSYREPCFVLQKHGCIISKDATTGQYVGGCVPILTVQHVVALTLEASQPRRDAAAETQRREREWVREVEELQRSRTDPARLAAVEKELAALKAERATDRQQQPAVVGAKSGFSFTNRR